MLNNCLTCSGCCLLQQLMRLSMHVANLIYLKIERMRLNDWLWICRLAGCPTLSSVLPCEAGAGLALTNTPSICSWYLANHYCSHHSDNHVVHISYLLNDCLWGCNPTVPKKNVIVRSDLKLNCAFYQSDFNLCLLFIFNYLLPDYCVLQIFVHTRSCGSISVYQFQIIHSWNFPLWFFNVWFMTHGLLDTMSTTAQEDIISLKRRKL